MNICGFAVYYISVTYIRYRFEQINDLVKKFIQLSRNKSNHNLLMCAIEEHNQITVLCMKNNQFANYVFLFAYYMVSPIIDITLYIAIHLENYHLKMFFYTFSFIIISLLFIFSLSTAQLQKSAHFSYKNLNSIIAQQKKIPLKMKMKIVGLIERLAGPEIAVYCYDFFPLDNYEFYLFIERISSNFFLLMNFIQL
jgi:hypothetical protein